MVAESLGGWSDDAFLLFKELVTCWVRDLVSCRTLLFDNFFKNFQLLSDGETLLFC